MGDWMMPFRPFPLSSECPFHDISPCRVGLTVSLSVSVLRYLSPCSWFVCMRLLAHLFSCLSSHLVFIKGGLCCCSNASMVWWFVSVSYVFSGWSYIQGDCSGWLPMHFGEMDHLPYRHARFVPSSSLVVLQISSLENLWFLHASVMQLFHDHLLVPVCGNICIVLGYLTWPRCRDPNHLISFCIFLVLWV